MKRLREHGDSPQARERQAARVLGAFDALDDSPVERARVRARMSEALARPRRIMGLRPVTLVAVLGVAATAAAAWMTVHFTRSSPVSGSAPVPVGTHPPAPTPRDRALPSALPPASVAPVVLPAAPPPIEDEPTRTADTPRPTSKRTASAQSLPALAPPSDPPEPAATPVPPSSTAVPPAATPVPPAAPAAPTEPVRPRVEPVRPRGEPVATPAEEARFVSAAVRALRVERNPALAADLLKAYLRRFPNGVLVEEALALAIEAAVARRDGAAPALARRYLQRFPNGRFREQAERVRQQPLDAR